MIERQGSDGSQYEAQWEAGVLSWEQSCTGVDPILERYARRLKGEVQPDDSLATARVLVWDRKRASYSISMVLEGSNLNVWATAWRDSEAALERRSLRPITARVETPIDPSDLDSQLRKLLGDLRQGTAKLFDPIDIQNGEVILSGLTPPPAS